MPVRRTTGTILGVFQNQFNRCSDLVLTIQLTSEQHTEHVLNR